MVGGRKPLSAAGGRKVMRQLSSVVSVVLDELRAAGVTHVFGVPGGPILPLYDALADQRHGIRSVLAKHEMGAAFMALGHAQAGGGIGVVCTTAGPGALNAMTGVASATGDSVPLLALTGQVATARFGHGGLQDSSGGNWGLDTVDAYRSAVKLSVMATGAAQVPGLVRHALATARSGRPGAVHVSLPADVWNQQCPVPAPTPMPEAAVPSAGSAAPVPSAAAVQELADALCSARRPAILAGQGAKLAGARESLADFAELLGVPVATTLKGKGSFPEDHPLALGVFGLGGNPLAHHYLLSKGVDLLLVVGSRLGEIATDGWNPALAHGRSVAQIDIDPLVIGRVFPADIRVVADARETLEALAERISRTRPRALPPDALRAARVCHALHPPAAGLQEGHRVLRASAVTARLSERLPHDTVLFVDVGNCLSWSGQYWLSRRPGTVLYSLNIAGMGYGTAAAIGGALALPQRPVVALVGDAAFAMAGMEVHTAAEYDVPVIWVVLDNGGHGMVENVQRIVYGRCHDALYRRPIDIAAVAAGLGAATATVTTLGELDEALTKAMGHPGPFVIDALVDPQEIPWALRGRADSLSEAIQHTPGDRR